MDQIAVVSRLLHNNFELIKTLDELSKLEMEYLGRHGKINELLKKMKDLPVENKKEYGQEINKLKASVKNLIDKKKKDLIANSGIDMTMDITLPGKEYPHGSLHPITTAIEGISRIFEGIGFVRRSYPEVELDYYSFTALNFPKDHPARDDFESFFIDDPKNPQADNIVLTPHTSSGQIREMEYLKGKPPIRMINIAKCYRRNWDATHAPMFYQFEGMVVDRNINITHLKGTIDYFAKNFFGPEREIRLRPHHFQFTEPSFETDISCNICHGKGTLDGKKCRVCKSGWMELGGSGMIHPNVLRAGGIDPEVYSGWAFGFGPERCLMMKLGLSEIRDLYAGDIRFLKQF